MYMYIHFFFMPDRQSVYCFLAGIAKVSNPPAANKGFKRVTMTPSLSAMQCRLETCSGLEFLKMPGSHLARRPVVAAHQLLGKQITNT